jgi:sulfatase modifying factor 1
MLCAARGVKRSEPGSLRARTFYADQRPQHRVYLEGYWIGKTEVTNAEYAKFIGTGGCSKRDYWTAEGWQWKESQGVTQPALRSDAAWNQTDCPVVGVNWYEAVAYAKWAGARLPTEAEWEKAARGGPQSGGHLYAGSDDADKVAWYVDNSGGQTHPVGQRKPNELVIYDMSGNVWEWCEDWYDAQYYGLPSGKNPSGPTSGTYRVLRGGSRVNLQSFLRCADRAWFDPDLRGGDVGFRVAE